MSPDTIWRALYIALSSKLGGASSEPLLRQSFERAVALFAELFEETAAERAVVQLPIQSIIQHYLQFTALQHPVSYIR